MEVEVKNEVLRREQGIQTEDREVSIERNVRGNKFIDQVAKRRDSMNRKLKE